MAKPTAKFTWEKDTIITAQCAGCKHFKLGDALLETKDSCPGFPAGIPEDIWANRHDHREVYPGDNGYRFESEY